MNNTMLIICQIAIVLMVIFIAMMASIFLFIVLFKTFKDCFIVQCNRMGSLFKEVYSDGTVKYHDNDYVVCADIDKPDVTYSFGLVSNIIHDMFPITMPYSPGKPIFVLCDCFLTDKANGDFDTVGVFSALKQNGNIVERTRFTKINKFFREASKDEKGPWVEITKKEYYERKAKAIKRK